MMRHTHKLAFQASAAGELVTSNAASSGAGLPRRIAATVCLVWAGLSAFGAASAEISLAGFGTIGYSRSNAPFTYDRFIDHNGTFRRDTVLGLQMDARFDNTLGATVQVKAAPRSDDDTQYQGTIAWAFLSYRPTNDWLFRAGRQRMPLYLHSANVDVGVTYDFARLPTEMYSISPNNEIDGLSFSRNWGLSGADLTLDGFWGRTNADVRLWARDDFAPIQHAGAMFRKLTIDGGGVGFTYRRDENTFRVAYGSVMVKDRDGSAVPITYPPVSTPIAGVTYYQVDDRLPGPGLQTVNRFRISSFIVGADVGFRSNYRAIGEFALTKVPQTDLSTQSWRGYVSLLRRVDKWTPYITYARIRSQSKTLNLYKNISNSSVPDSIPGSAIINASQRAGADQILAFDQSSLAMGAAYALSATSKLKAEIMRVRIGEISGFVDAPPASNIRNRSINVISLSYSKVF